MATEDLTFGFDTSFFEKGISKISKGMEGLQTTAGAVAKGVSKGLTAVAMKFGSVFAGAKAIQGALKNMPEIGEAFGIAKNIFLKNLLFPLRKEIFPLLQKMLDWVRDSRGTFIKWGNALANIFRSVVSGVKTVISFISKMAERVAGFTKRIFGDQIRSITDLFNIVSFKLSTVIQFVSILIGNVRDIFSGFFSGLGDIGGSFRGIVSNMMEFLSLFTEANEKGDSFAGVVRTIANRFGELVGFVVRMTDKFLDGFVPAVREIMTPLQKIADAWDGIMESIFGSTESLEKWDGLFQGLGSLIGTGIQKSFEFIAAVLEDIEESINSIKEFGFLNTLAEQTGNLFRAVGGALGFGNDQDNSAVPTPIVASPSSTTNNKTQTFTQTNSPTIIIQNGTEQAGRDVAEGFVDKMRDIFNREFERSGQ